MRRKEKNFLRDYNNIEYFGLEISAAAGDDNLR